MTMRVCTECGRRIKAAAPLEAISFDGELIVVVDFGCCICPQCAEKRLALHEKIYQLKEQLRTLSQKIGEKKA